MLMGAPHPTTGPEAMAGGMGVVGRWLSHGPMHEGIPHKQIASQGRGGEGGGHTKKYMDPPM